MLLLVKRLVKEEMVTEGDIEEYAQKLYEAKQEGKDKEFLEMLKGILTAEEIEEVKRKAKIIEERESVFAKLKKLKESISKAEPKKEKKEEVEFIKAEIKPAKAEKEEEESKAKEKEEVEFVSSLEKEEEEELLPGELPGEEIILPSEEETAKELALFEEKKLGLEEVAGEKPLAAKELTPAQEQAMAIELILSALERGFTPNECIDMLLESGFAKEQTFQIIKMALKKKGLSYR